MKNQTDINLEASSLVACFHGDGKFLSIIMGEKHHQQSNLAVNPMSYKHGLAGCAHWCHSDTNVMGVTNHFLI